MPKFWGQPKNFSQFWKIFTSKLKNLRISAIRFQKTTVFFLYFLIKITVFYTKNLFTWAKHCVQIIFYNKKYKKFRKNQFFSNIFTFLCVIRQNFEDNLRILANFEKFSRKNSKIYGFAHTFSKNYSFFFVFFNKDYSFLH